jgi:predicted Zn finger-like uncharacterized protein
MERIFWVGCPECQGKFYCNYNEMRHAGIKLMCPFCRHRFLPDEAAWLDERVDASRSPAAPAGPGRSG